jgi:uncharacterized membrane protein
VANTELVVRQTPAATAPAPIGGPDFMTVAATLGLVTAGVALFEAALIPGLVIGGAAVLAPPYVRRRLGPLGAGVGKRVLAALRPKDQQQQPEESAAKRTPGGFAVKQAVVKTITYRIIVTSLDFTTNVLVIGDLGTAAGLSSFAFVAGPVFYFVHETAWNYFGGPVSREGGKWGTAVDIPLLPPTTAGARAGRRRMTVNRSVAKTITFRTIATTMDFTTNYVVLRDFGMAAALTAVGFVVGPFVYFGHEMVWDRLGSGKKPAPAPV